MAWTTPFNLSVDAGASQNPDVAVGPDGTVHAVWTNLTTAQMEYSSRPVGGSWSTPVVVATYAGTTISRIDSRSSIIWAAPCVIVTRSDSMMALTTKALPVSR